ncbi:MAG: single-stranded DNA-binding protein [Myxococcales bacterium]
MSTSREHVNAAELVGRLGQSPELRRTEDGTPYVRLSIATAERFTDKGGEIRERTEWHNGIAWGKSAEEIAERLQKGDSVSVSGTLRINSFEKDGAKNRVTEINVAEAHKNLDNAPSKNDTRLVGVVREEPKARDLGDGKQMTVISVATKTLVNGKDGSREREDWHSVTAWGKTAEAAREIRAGDTVAINGSLRHRTIPGEGGHERRVSAIECQKFQVIERAQDLGVSPQIRRAGKAVDRGI